MNDAYLKDQAKFARLGLSAAEYKEKHNIYEVPFTVGNSSSLSCEPEKSEKIGDNHNKAATTDRDSEVKNLDTKDGEKAHAGAGEGEEEEYPEEVLRRFEQYLLNTVSRMLHDTTILVFIFLC